MMNLSRECLSQMCNAMLNHPLSFPKQSLKKTRAELAESESTLQALGMFANGE